MKKNIAIAGGGGLGRELLTLINATQDWKAIGFYDDQIALQSVIKNLPVLGMIDDLSRAEENLAVVIAIGDVIAKEKIVQRLANNSYLQYPVLIHPQTLLQDITSIHLGIGSIIAAGSILTTDIKVGDHVLINLACTIGHGTSIGNGCSIMPGVNIAGEVVIGNQVLIGSGANILSGVNIGDHARIGSGAVVTKNVRRNSTVVGIPAREIGQ